MLQYVGMLYIVWEFRIKKTARKEFEIHYSCNGTWAKLFRKSPDYIESVLIKDRVDRERYLVMDIWKDWNSFRTFKSKHKKEYESLDRDCERLTKKETWVGNFRSL